MKYLLAIISLLFFSSIAIAKPSCDTKNPLKHSKNVFEANSKKPIKFKKIKINADKKNDVLIYDMDSCSSKGCETAVYLSYGRKCFTYSGLFKEPILRKDKSWYLQKSQFKANKLSVNKATNKLEAAK